MNENESDLSANSKDIAIKDEKKSPAKESDIIQHDVYIDEIKSAQELPNNPIITTVSIAASSSPLNICHVSLTDAGMLLESGDIIQPSLENTSSSIQFEDGTTAFIRNFEQVDESDSNETGAKFVDGQVVQLEDGSTAFIHATPREGLQAVQLEDGTMAYLSQTGVELFNGEASGLDLENISSPQIGENEEKEKDVNMGENACQISGTQSAEKTFKCYYANCNRFYTTLHHLKVHQRSHTGDRPFKCRVSGCGKAFATGYGLKSHTRVHTGETPYKCQEEACQKAFKTSGDLQKHVRTHTGERPFKCPFKGCDRAFTTSNIRKVHIRTHTGERPYVCKMEGCGRAFASATNYKNHIRIHTGEKPYVCSVSGCNKRFTEYSSLYKHHVVHTHSKPYICSTCGKNYRQTSTLAMHKRTAHGIFEQLEEAASNLATKNDETSNQKNNEKKENVKVEIKSEEHNDTAETSLSVTKTFPAIITLQSEGSNQIVQEHPVYAVQLQQDGSLSTTMQQIVLVADSTQVATLQQLVQQGQLEAIIPSADRNTSESS